MSKKNQSPENTSPPTEVDLKKSLTTSHLTSILESSIESQPSQDAGTDQGNQDQPSGESQQDSEE